MRKESIKSTHRDGSFIGHNGDNTYYILRFDMIG
jgi:hypothetical protein